MRFWSFQSLQEYPKRGPRRAPDVAMGRVSNPYRNILSFATQRALDDVYLFPILTGIS